MGRDRLKDNSKSIILTLEETLEDQKDLKKLCTDRPLETNEIYWLNAVYGLDWILKEYANLPYDEPLKAVIPHGIYLTEDVIIDPDATADLPVILCRSLHEYRGYQKLIMKYGFNKLVLYSACPFLYVVELLKHVPKPERKGTIFFLPHSTPYMTLQTDFEALAEELESLEDKYQPVTVCAYWSDVNLDHHVPFQQRGFKIVSAGHMYDPRFLFRFYHLCSTHRYSTSNALGSHLFYSIKSGCSYFHLEKISCAYKTEEPNQQKYIEKWSSVEENSDLPSLFKFPPSERNKEQIKIADYYLGTDHFKSPDELLHQLNQAKLLYEMDLRPELHWSQHQLHTTRTDLQETQEQLKNVRFDLEKTQEKSRKTHNELQNNQVKLQQTQAQLQQAQDIITGMKSSKFWKLRERWFQIKRAAGLKESN